MCLQKNVECCYTRVAQGCPHTVSSHGSANKWALNRTCSCKLGSLAISVATRLKGRSANGKRPRHARRSTGFSSHLPDIASPGPQCLLAEPPARYHTRTRAKDYVLHSRHAQRSALGQCFTPACSKVRPVGKELSTAGRAVASPKPCRTKPQHEPWISQGSRQASWVSVTRSAAS
jgi:hypothetical protein